MEQHCMPAAFIGPGSPMNTLERNRCTDAWRTFGATVPRPRAILVISDPPRCRATPWNRMAPLGWCDIRPNRGRTDMRWLRTARSAGLVALAVTATVLAGAAPASADITVDSAVCLANTKADITVPKPVVHAPEHAEMAWVVLLSTYCTAANAKIFLVYLEMPYEVQVPPVADVDLFVGGRWKLSLRTSLGRKDLGTVTVQVI